MRQWLGSICFTLYLFVSVPIYGTLVLLTAGVLFALLGAVESLLCARVVWTRTADELLESVARYCQRTTSSHH